MGWRYHAPALCACAIKETVVALTLRRTRLETSPVYAHLKDYCVFEDGNMVGRIYELRPPTPPGAAWFWSILVHGPGRRRVETDNRAATFEEAKAEFAASWEAFKAIGNKSP
jgi:hypothetical protein